MAPPKDTSPDAWARQIAALRALTPQERLRLATTMSDDVRDLARAGIRARRPGSSAEEVDAALADLLLGVSLARAARATPRPPGATTT